MTKVGVRGLEGRKLGGREEGGRGCRREVGMRKGEMEGG